MPAIEVKDLIKKYKTITAVNNISFKVKKGEIFGFLGPNGAGKSTTIKMLTTLLKPTSGELFVDGYDVLLKKNEVRKSIGVIFQDYSLDDELTPFENLNYHCALYKIPKSKRKQKINKMLKKVGLLDRKNDYVKKFSGGMKRRVEIARGLLHEPKILFLDEPTLGLDVQTRTLLWDQIKKLNKEKGITIFFTTHNLDEAERIATRIAIIDKGKILINDTSKQIKKKTKSKSLETAFLKLTGYNIREQNNDPNERMRRLRK